MGLLNDIFQQNQMQQPISALTPKKQNIFDAYSQQIAPKELAGMETRTPTQIAYDNLLNREAEINQQNKRNNFVSGLMSGIGGLGKVIANSVVSNPYQKAGAMEGIGEQETRLDGLRQAYDQARQQQNKDFVNQAREQLGLAREDEDKNWNRDLTKEQIAYKKLQDDIANKLNQDKFDFTKNQAEIEHELRNKEFGLKEQIANAQKNKIQAEIKALQNKPEKTEEDIIKLQKAKVELAKEEEALKKAQYENSDEYKQEQKTQKQNDQIISMAKDLFDKKQINGEQFNQIVNNPQSFKKLENRNWFTRFWKKVPFTDTNTLRFDENKNTNNDPLGVL